MTSLHNDIDQACTPDTSGTLLGSPVPSKSQEMNTLMELLRRVTNKVNGRDQALGQALVKIHWKMQMVNQERDEQLQRARQENKILKKIIFEKDRTIES